MSAAPNTARGTFCLACNAVGDATASTCWLCGSTQLRPLGPTAPSNLPATSTAKDAEVRYIGEAPAGPRPHGAPSYIKPIVTLIGVLLAGAFLLGLWKESPGLGVIVTLIVGVVLLSTVGHGRPSSDPGTRASGSILRIFAGVATTLASIALIVVVSVVAMFCFALVTCLGMLKGG